MQLRSWVVFCSLFCLSAATGFAADSNSRVLLPEQPDIAPDGKTLIFAYRGDIWRVATKGGRAARLTTHSATDAQPMYSPDGKTIAFISNRSGSSQVFVMNASGGPARQLTFHTEGYSLQDWYPDGQSLLVLGSRDHHWRSSSRFMKISATQRSKEEILFNGYGTEGRISPDGDSMLFVREGERWWRKGYTGARSAQIWSYNFSSKKFTKLVDTPAGDRTPAWAPDGKSFFYCSSHGAKNGARNLWQYTLADKSSKQLTKFKDDLVVTPTISANGNTVVFGHLFDLYSMKTDKQAPPTKINIRLNADDETQDVMRRTLTTATDAAFSKDGLEIAFISGGDLWVMETELKEPVRITDSAEFESDPVFSDDGNSLLFVGWKDGQPDIWKVERADDSKYWWQSSEFKMTQLTDDAELESDLTLSPNKEELIYARGRGAIHVRNLKSGDDRKLIEGFVSPSYDVSPDGKWLVYALTDDDFNTDIWITSIDGSSDPVNISRHPDDEFSPKWSSDGKKIAFSGRRMDDETDIYYVYLTKADTDTGSRDRKLKKTLEALKKSRGSNDKPAPPASGKNDKPDAPEKTAENKEEDPSEKTDADAEKAPEKKAGPQLPVVKIDFDGIHRRLRRISIPNSAERILGWSPDGKKLLFAGTVKNESGTFMVSFPDEMTPKKVSSATGSIKGWLKSPDRILWLASGVPAAQPLAGSAKSYSFSAYQQLSQSARYTAAFETAWRIMRDAWYDDNYGNHNWNQVRRKYLPAASSAGNTTELTRVISLMLGELNGSHLGFRASGSSSSSRPEWRPTTGHLGVRFDHAHKGPGLKISEVIPNGPADDTDSLITAGETILSIDGTDVDPDLDLTTVLNGRPGRDVQLRVKAADKEGLERIVTIRPTSYGSIRSLLYQKWQDDNRKLVAQRADNIGYLHIQGMNWPSFLDFERELYDVGYGKDGLIIDVRDNGGGFTTDHLLTALTQPQHAITVPRGGGPGYPQSRMVYATWNKPIVVLCNQNSYSNAEIFSHAIKNLGRGKLIGVPTAGGVISTGAASVMDLGTLRLPFRGWFVSTTGEDMELNGAVPDVIVWPQPTEIPNGKDRQLMKAVQVLTKDINTWKAKERPELRKATER